jgi:hypothetical protein
MQGHFPDPGAMSDVVSAFANAPIDNPDNIPGVKLHVDVGDSIPHQDVIKAFNDFDTLKNEYFGTPEQRSDSNIWNILDAKALVYHYCLFVHTFSQNKTGEWKTSNAVGLGECPGNDFIVGLGASKDGKGTRDEQAADFMHELGHNLNLNHGGGDKVNYKPNYLSIMNYAFCFSDLVGWRPLDYSRKQLPTLNEKSLDESLGIQHSGYWKYTIWNWSDKEVAVSILRGLANGPKDWNNNATIEYLVHVNVNNFPAFEYSSPPDEPLAGYDDWAKIKLYFLDTQGVEDGMHPQVPNDEITWEIVDAMRETQIMGVEPTSPAPTADGSPQTSPGDQGAGSLMNTNYLIIGAVVAAVVVVVVVLVVFRKRKRQLA